MRVPLQSQNLLFDADDTLWENNIYFEQAIAQFLTQLDHMPHSREEIREHLNQCEIQNIARLGYGLHSFRASLVQCFEDLTQARISEDVHRRVQNFAREIATHEMELITGVPETLAYLAPRHTLFLVTKGVPAEQHDKLKRSGLAPFFSEIEVLAEKSPEAYAEITSRHGLAHASTWMVGNSPKSDVHAALSADLNAVHVPHPVTWILEHCDICEPHPGRKLLNMATFADLRDWF